MLNFFCVFDLMPFVNTLLYMYWPLPDQFCVNSLECGGAVSTIVYTRDTNLVVEQAMKHKYNRSLKHYNWTIWLRLSGLNVLEYR